MTTWPASEQPTPAQDEPVVPAPDPASEPTPPAPEVEPEVAPTPAEAPAEPAELTVDDHVALRTLPTVQTAVDAQGTTRVVVPDLNASGWKPAPLEPDPAEVARVEARQAAIVEQDKARAEALGLTGQ